MPVSFLKIKWQFGDIFVTLKSSSATSVHTGESARDILGKSLPSVGLCLCFAEKLCYTPSSELAFGTLVLTIILIFFTIIFICLLPLIISVYEKKSFVIFSCLVFPFKDLIKKKYRHFKKLGWQCLWFLWVVIQIFAVAQGFLLKLIDCPVDWNIGVHLVGPVKLVIFKSKCLVSVSYVSYLCVKGSGGETKIEYFCFLVWHFNHF